MSRTGYRAIMSARVIVEGLAVAGIIWLASSVTSQNIAIAHMQTQLAGISSSLASVPANTRDIAQLQTEIADQSRRLEHLEAHQP